MSRADKLITILAWTGIAGAAMAGPPRSMVFQSELPDGSTIILELDDEDYAAPEYDGGLEFVGTVTPPMGDPYDFSLRTDIGLLSTATRVCAVTFSTASGALAIGNTSTWVALTETTQTTTGSNSVTDIVTNGVEAELAMTGDFSDLATVASGLYSTGTLDLALAQSLVFVLSAPGSCTTPHVNLATCINSAKDACGYNGVASVDFEIETDADGNVISTSCSFTCKDPCPS